MNKYDTVEKIVDLFNQEFSSILDKFRFIDVSLNEAPNSDIECIWHPGVYIWFHPSAGVLKIGRSLSNARKRALEHARESEETNKEMRKHADLADVRLLFFNLIIPDDYHWAAAVEILLENKLGPLTRSKRTG